MKNKFFIIGLVVNLFLFVIVYMDCGGFFGCGQTARSVTTLSFIFNLPVSFLVGSFASSLTGKVFLFGLCGTIVNAYILNSIFGRSKKVEPIQDKEIEPSQE